jgi:predicted kinase
VYDEMFQRGSGLLAQRISVVLDGTFSGASHIVRAHDLGGARLAVHCVCRREVAQERIRGRMAEGRDASEASPALHDRQRDEWEDWPPTIEQVSVDTEQPLERQVEAVIAALRAVLK